MRIAENKYYMYKADGVEIVDLTNDVISADLEGGSVLNLGDGYTDSPIKTISISLQNSNNRLYSPHFEANKVKYDMSLTLIGNGGSTYNSPKLNTIDVVTPNINYGCTYIKGKIELSHNLPIGQELEIWVTYIDTTEKNPINHLSTNVYSPIIQERNIFVWEQSVYEKSFQDYLVYGNNTDTLSIYNTNIANIFYIFGTKKEHKPVNYFEICQENYFVECGKNYYKLTQDEFTFDTVGTTYNVLEASNYYELSQKNYFELCSLNTDDLLEIVSFAQTGNQIDIKFNRVIYDNEIILLMGSFNQLVDSELKFVGKVNGNVTSDIKTCKFNCKDLSYDFQEKKINPSDFRNYFTEKENDVIITKEEVITKAIVSSDTLSVSFNNLNEKFTNNETVYLYDDQNFYETTLAITSDTTATVTNIADGNYSVYKKYIPSLYLEQFIQNCVEDLGLNYSLFVKDFSDFAIIPKVSEMQMDNLWSFLQNIVAKRGMCLHFVYTKDTETYFNVDGTTKQGTNSFELILQEIPQNNTVSKFEIFEADIEDNVQFDSTGSLLINSYEIGYYSAETDQVERKVIDDFDLSVYQATIQTERNIIVTDELLSTNEGTNTIRINNEYRQVVEAINSSTYRVNLAFSESGTFNLFMMGTYSKKYGLKRAYYDLDSTSEIDTEQEAINFGNLLLNQYLDIYATYKFKVYSRNFPFLKNFDVVKINSPRFNLLGKNMFVQSINEDSQFTEFTVSEIMHLGKWKYYEMKVERGQNTITDTTKINTADVFPPVTNLIALDPSIDDLQNYVVYSRVSWNKLIGMNVTSYELQYKKSTEEWTNAETITLTENSMKLVLKEQVLYNIRVRGTGKEQVKGQWATTTVDASKYLIENPIQNRTWYIRLFAGNDEVEYFSQFDKLGYTNQYLIDNIDTIEIVPNADKGNKQENYVSLVFTDINGIKYGIEKKIDEKLILSTNRKSLILNKFNGYYKIEGLNFSNSLPLDGNKWNDIEGFPKATIKLFKAYSFLFIPLISNNVKKLIKNIEIFIVGSTYSSTDLITGILSGDYNDNYFLENIYIEFLGEKTSFSNIRGFEYTNNINNCITKNLKTGFLQCRKISKNTTINCTIKYSGCYASSDTSVAIPIGGSDSSTYGWNI